MILDATMLFMALSSAVATALCAYAVTLHFQTRRLLHQISGLYATISALSPSGSPPGDPEALCDDILVRRIEADIYEAFQRAPRTRQRLRRIIDNAVADLEEETRDANCSPFG